MFFAEPFGGLLPGAAGAVLSVLLRTGVGLTGRQIHRLISGGHSLGSVQGALKTLATLGLVDSHTVGRAGVHSINEAHVAVPHLRALVDPLETLTKVISETVGADVEDVFLFGSVARGEADRDSDVDLVVVAPSEWEGRLALEDAVRARLGNACDVLAFSREEFDRLAGEGEPVIRDVLEDGIALLGERASQGSF